MSRSHHAGDNRLPHIDLDHLQCRAQWSRTWPEGRRCDVCGVELSRYNSEKTCYAHRPEPVFAYNGMWFKRCDICGYVAMGRGRKRVATFTCPECARGGDDE